MSHRYHFITPTSLTALICFLYILGVLVNHQLDPFAFVLLGTKYSQNLPQGTEGYDGQFAYQIALKPFHAAPHLDVPAYRYQRILYPLLARLLALGQPSLIPWTLLLTNFGAIVIGTWATAQILKLLKTNPWYALIYGLYGGQLLALRTDTHEPLAQALVQLAILAWLNYQLTPKPLFEIFSILAFTLAALAKETTLIFWGAYFFSYVLQQDRRKCLKFITVIIPFIVYQLSLWQWLGQPGLGSGGAGATPFSLIPLGGWLAVAQANFRGFLLISLVVVPISILPALIGLRLSGRRLWQTYHPFVISLFLHSLILLCLPASTMREPAAMARLTQGLVTAMVLYGAWTKSPRILMYSTLWLFTGALLLHGVAK